MAKNARPKFIWFVTLLSFVIGHSLLFAFNNYSSDCNLYEVSWRLSGRALGKCNSSPGNGSSAAKQLPGNVTDLMDVATENATVTNFENASRNRTNTSIQVELATNHAVPQKIEVEHVISSDHQHDIVFCVLTAKRPNGTYLSVALRSLDKELKLMKTDQSILTLVVDVSVDDVDRTEIQAARAEFPAFAFQSVTNKTWENCSEEERNSDSKTYGKPPCSVKQQTRDVAAALNQCSLHASTSGWVILLEDDTELCHRAVSSMLANLALLSKKPRAWRCMSFSTYFSGTAIANAKLARYTSHLMERLADRPVDHLVWEDWAEGNCFEYTGNLLSHKGYSSVFQYRNAKEFRDAYDNMRFSPRQVDCVIPSIQEMAVLFADKEADFERQNPPALMVGKA